jgi:hypothetical protein
MEQEDLEITGIGVRIIGLPSTMDFLSLLTPENLELPWNS